MDEQLQAKIEEARAAGYSDEEINQYLTTKNQPLPQEQPIDRTGEYGAVAQQIVPEAVKYGAEGLGAYYAGKKLINAVRGPTPAVPAASPAVPTAVQTQPQPMLNETWDKALKQPIKPAVPTGAQSIVQKIALDKVLKNAGVIGAGMQIAQGLFGTTPEEVQTMKEAEARKRAQGWKPLNER